MLTYNMEVVGTHVMRQWVGTSLDPSIIPAEVEIESGEGRGGDFKERQMTAKWIHPTEEGRTEEKPDGDKEREMREVRRSGKRVRKVMRQQSAPERCYSVARRYFSPASLGFPPPPPSSKLTKKRQQSSMCLIPFGTVSLGGRRTTFLMSCSLLDQ